MEYPCERAWANPGALEQVFAALHRDRPRPVGVELPYDLLIAKAEGRLPPTETEAPPAPDARAIEQAAEAIVQACFPVLYVGGSICASGAMDALRALAERLGAPVVMSDNGRGALTERHPLAMNSLAGRALFEVADLVLVVGSRFMNAMTPTPSWPTDGEMRYIHLNIDPADFTPPRSPELAIRADARLALEALHERVAPRQVLSNAQAERVREWARVQIQAVSPQAEYIAAIPTTIWVDPSSTGDPRVRAR